MNTVVWILIAISYSGHGTNSIMPTIEFGSQEKCEAAIRVFDADSKGKPGSVHMRCVKIEK